MNKTQSNDDEQTLPPYGPLNATYLATVRDFTFMPGDWRDLSGQNATEYGWDDFFHKTLHLINEVLWPNYGPGGWEDSPARKFMIDLTRADLGLLVDLRKKKQIEKAITPPGASKSSPTHLQLFQEEDTAPQPIGTNYNQEYDPTLAPRLAQKIPVLWRRALNTKLGMSVLRFKMKLQRPRAYQTSLLLGYEDFTYEQALSADTPSMCSGHCVQGALTIAASMEVFLLDNEKLTADSWLALEQFTVDLGDRRVMAGVHYPSDNICSWLIAMLMADHVYRTPEVKKKLWHAISTRSLIYKLIQDSVKSGKGDVYKPSLNALKDAALGKISFP